MTASADVEAEIRRLHYAEHWPIGTVAHQVGVHEDVVRRVLGLLERREPAEPRPRLIDPYTNFIDETLKQYPRLRATRIYDMVRARGYGGSVRTLREHVATVRPRPRREAYLRTSTLVAEQAQIDWAYVGEVPVLGGLRRLWLFVMVLSWSRAMWGEFVFDLGIHSLLRSLVRAAAAFGGTCRQWLFDNPKTVVLERMGDAVRFHPLLVELAGHFHVQLRVCAVRKANQKGRVERAIRYLRERFLAARHIVGREQGNHELADFIAEIAHPRPHPELAGRTVADCLAEERKSLLVLPEPMTATEIIEPIGVDKTAFIRFDRNSYSVPPAHVEQTLTLAADDFSVRLLDGQTEVARHDRCWGKKQRIELPEHRSEILAQKRAAAPAKGRDRLRAAVPDMDALYARWVEAGRNIGSMTARTLKLLDLYGEHPLAQAVAAVLARGTSDPGAIAQLCEEHRRAASRPVPVALVLPQDVPDRDVIPHALESYDADRRR
jgi:transposase